MQAETEKNEHSRSFSAVSSGGAEHDRFRDDIAVILLRIGMAVEVFEVNLDREGVVPPPSSRKSRGGGGGTSFSSKLRERRWRVEEGPFLLIPDKRWAKRGTLATISTDRRG